MPEHRYPFGAPMQARPPRRPDGPARLLVLGVYPSALHVRWTPPAWAVEQLGAEAIGALAVDDEPVVFWDGTNPPADAEVDRWKTEVGFLEGDEPGRWGHVQAAGNGTSGRPVRDRLLGPLGVEPAQTWFTDAVNTYFLKSGPGSQGSAWETRYRPFALSAGLVPASMPPRPPVEDLVQLAATEHLGRLRAELEDSRAPLVVTLGEEARQVLAAIADSSSGPPTKPLGGAALGSDYGEAGEASVGTSTFRWMALVHPGQRSEKWRAIHDAWMARRAASRG